jgi:hypothetical protein
MWRVIKLCGLPISAAALLVVASHARAQFQPAAPGYGAAPPVPAPSGYVGNQAGYPYPVPNPYGGYYESQLGGYLRGTADLVNSQSNWIQGYEQARMTREQSNQMKIDTKRKAYDEWLYERNNAPTFEQDRSKSERAQLDRMLGNPSPTIIASGEALNTLLYNIQKTQSAAGPGPSVPVSENLLSKITVTGGNCNGGIALLRNDGKLFWPVPLQTPAYDDDRRVINELAPKAVAQAKSGNQPDVETLRELRSAVARMQAALKQSLPQITPNDAITAKRFLNQLDDGFKTLQGPNAANYLNGTWAAHGNTVGEVVTGMTQQGLKFAPAAMGNESAYQAMYSAMRAYDTTLASLTAMQAPPGQAPGP